MEQFTTDLSTIFSVLSTSRKPQDKEQFTADRSTIFSVLSNSRKPQTSNSSPQTLVLLVQSNTGITSITANYHSSQQTLHLDKSGLIALAN